MSKMVEKPLKIGIACYPSVGGSGIVATTLGVELAKRGHQVHFISYERPFRLPTDQERIFFHAVAINDYGLFKYPDYTLPLSVKMSEVSRQFELDIMHVHYAVPHATAAILSRCMLPPNKQPKVITTLHGTDTTLLGRDPGYGPAILHALTQSDAVTTVSEYLKKESRSVIGFDGPISVIYNFFEPHTPKKSRAEIRKELGIGEELMILHSSNLRPMKRIDLLLETASRIEPRGSFKLVILAGARFEPFMDEVRRLKLEDTVIVRENVLDVEDYLAAADIGLTTSESESFCLSILEAMFFGCPSVSTSVGGIPEFVDNNQSGLLVPFGSADDLARACERLIQDHDLRSTLGATAKVKAEEKFSADSIVPQYEDLYARVTQKVSCTSVR